MCGVAGYLTSQTGPPRTSQLHAAMRALAHRGPDGQHIYENERIGFVQTRLAVSDRSAHSQQPIIDPQTGSVLVFNGEIFNYRDLRAGLKAKSLFPLHGHGDLEVLFAGLLTKGISFIDELNGDFAFVFYDGRTQQVWMARDRLGVKPLYYASSGADVIFASEIRALRAMGLTLRARAAAWNSVLALRYCRENETVFQDVHRLPPAHYMRVDADGRQELVRYWTPLVTAAQDRKDADVEARLQELLEDSIRLRLHSERATGFFLSGGMDSGLIADVARSGDAQAEWSAFTCALTPQHPDVQRSRELAARLKLKQHVYEHVDENFEEALGSLEEPIGDSIISPLYGLCETASRDATVLLAGEGADEIFGGYAHHAFIPFVLNLPRPASKMAGWTTSWAGRGLFGRANPLYPVQLAGEAISRIERCFQSREGLPDVYHIISDVFGVEERAEILGENADDLRGATNQLLRDAHGLSPIKQLIYLELAGWLPHYNLLKLDKLTSAFGMEGRVPYLDHRIVELIFSLEDRHLWNFTRRKPLLRKLAQRRPGLKVYPKIPFFHAQADFERMRGEVMRRISVGKIPDGFRPDSLRKMATGLQNSDFIHKKKLELIYLSIIWEGLQHG